MNEREERSGRAGLKEPLPVTGPAQVSSMWCIGAEPVGGPCGEVTCGASPASSVTVKKNHWVEANAVLVTSVNRVVEHSFERFVVCQILYRGRRRAWALG